MTSRIPRRRHSVDRDRPPQNADLEEHMVFGIEDTVLQGDHGRQAAQKPGNSAQSHAATQSSPPPLKDRADKERAQGRRENCENEGGHGRGYSQEPLSRYAQKEQRGRSRSRGLSLDQSHARGRHDRMRWGMGQAPHPLKRCLVRYSLQGTSKLYSSMSRSGLRLEAIERLLNVGIVA